MTLANRLDSLSREASQGAGFDVEGRLVRHVGLALEVAGCEVPLGGVCDIIGNDGQPVAAEVVGFGDGRLYLMPLGNTAGLVPGAIVRPRRGEREVIVGDGLLGRVLDGHGQPLDDLGPLSAERAPASTPELNPLQRKGVSEPLDVGVRAINGLLTVGAGQRLGLFAGSGVGKSVLLGMMTRFTEADVVVVALIGERAREVKEFVEDILGSEGRRRAVVVVATASDPALLRTRATLLAARIAEHFRESGRSVLFLMDSLTRYVQAHREIGLAIGEPPATRGYPPSAFAAVPSLVERAGPGTGTGSITAFYTVLTEGDETSDPVADAARAILDGHVFLSRHLAERGIWPAIDIERSVSRVMPAITGPDQQRQALGVRRLWGKYQAQADLISVGAYAPGSDPEVDRAIELVPHIEAYISQEAGTPVPMAAALAALDAIGA